MRARNLAAVVGAAVLMLAGCSDTGDFAVIGTVVDHNAVELPPDAGVADHEVMVIVPRCVLVDARDDIPEA